MTASSTSNAVRNETLINTGNPGDRLVSTLDLVCEGMPRIYVYVNLDVAAPAAMSGQLFLNVRTSVGNLYVPYGGPFVIAPGVQATFDVFIPAPAVRLVATAPGGILGAYPINNILGCSAAS